MTRKMTRNPTTALITEILIVLCATFGPIAFAAADVAVGAADRGQASHAGLDGDCTEEAAV